MSSDTILAGKQLILACESDALDPLHEAFAQIEAQLAPGFSDEDKDTAIANFINSTTNSVGVPALHVAVRQGSVDVIEELVEFPINVEVLDSDQNSILHAAIKLTETNLDAGDELTRLFLLAGTPLSLRNNMGFTAVMQLEQYLRLHLPPIVKQFSAQIPDAAKFQFQNPSVVVQTLRQIPDQDDNEAIQRVIGWADLHQAIQKEQFAMQAMGDVVVDDEDGDAGSESD